MLSKKSQVHSQFNWMFVLMVGGFFLLLFFGLSTRQAESAQQRISATALQGISNIFESARTGTSMSASVRIPYLTIEFSCETGLFGDHIYSEYRVGGFSRRIDGLPTFVPGDLTGDNLVTWTQSWNIPFSVMNFLFIVNDQTRFFFINNPSHSEIFNSIEDSFSSNMKSEFLESINDPRFADFNDDYSIIVIFSDNENHPVAVSERVNEIFSGSTRIVQIVPDDEIFGKVIYYDEDGFDGQVQYAGRASLYGAIFSPSDDYYECSMRKALERFSRVACIYHQKHIALQEHYSDDVQCRGVYNAVVNSFLEFFDDELCSSDGDIIKLDANQISFEEKYNQLILFYNTLVSTYNDARRYSCSRPY